MDQTALNAVRNWFDAYTRSFAADGGGLPPMLQLKLDHSRRVADDCAAIARDLGWSAAETAAAEALGLLHDTARFPQYATYRTFSDRRSIDHGEHGRLIVEREGVLAAAGDVYGRSILDGIRYHNKRDVPAGLAGPANDDRAAFEGRVIPPGEGDEKAWDNRANDIHGIGDRRTCVLYRLEGGRPRSVKIIGPGEGPGANAAVASRQRLTTSAENGWR